MVGELGKSLLTSNCTTVDDCTLSLFPISQGWIQAFLQQVEPVDSSPANPFRFTRDEFYHNFNKSVAEYTSTMSFNNPDLGPLKNSGAKMIVWHGMVDAVVPTNATVDYYESVLQQMVDDNIDDFYRLYLAPGVGHCGNGAGLDPRSEAFFELVAWVENGTVPETMAGVGPAVGPGNTTATRTIGLCPYPKVLTFNGSDPNDAEDFICA